MTINQFLLSLILCVYVPALFGAENFTSIRKWQDAAPFANSFVVYESSDPYFQKEGGYSFPSARSLRYGYVDGSRTEWQGGPDAYEMRPLLTKGTRPTMCFISDYTLSKGGLQMKKATLEQMRAILAVVDREQAGFNYDEYGQIRDRLAAKAQSR